MTLKHKHNNKNKKQSQNIFPFLSFYSTKKRIGLAKIVINSKKYFIKNDWLRFFTDIYNSYQITFIHIISCPGERSDRQFLEYDTCIIIYRELFLIFI